MTRLEPTPESQVRTALTMLSQFIGRVGINPETRDRALVKVAEIRTLILTEEPLGYWWNPTYNGGQTREEARIAARAWREIQAEMGKP